MNDYEPTREDVLIGRVVDHEASPADWARLDELAQDDPTLWARLGRAQRAHAGLRIAIEDAIARAELVDIPEGRAHGAGRRSVIARIGSFAGWAAAAALLLALINPALRGTASPGSSLAGFTLLSQASPEEAYTQYVASGLADGRVVSEMPTLLLEQQTDPDTGRTEVLVVRRIVERLAFDNSMHTFAYLPDEYGQPSLTPTSEAMRTLMQSRQATTPDPPTAPATMDF